jgi:hypothetical protein
MGRYMAGMATAVGVAVLLSAAGGVASADSFGQLNPSCIAVAMPSVQGVPGSAEDAAAGVRDLMTKYLSGPSIKVLALESRLSSQAAEEAKQKGCEPILFTSVARKTGGGKLARALGQAAGSSSWYLPGGSTVATAAARAGAAAGLQTASALASSTKAKDEMRVDYRLQSATGQVQFGPRSETRTASVDGEDLLTPIVTRAAETLVMRNGAR